jgi:hypothetical protein
LTWLYFFISDKKVISWFWIIFSSFLFALTISLKFSALFIITLIAVMLVSKFKTLEKRLIASVLLILFSIGFFCLINWNIFYSKEVFNIALHDYFSNFWQYATGNKGVVVEHFKLFNLKRVVGELYSSLGGLVFLFPIILFFGLKWSSRKSALTWLGFTGIILLSIAAIVKQQVYIDRNILPFLTALVLITGVMLDKIVKHILNSNFNKVVKPSYLYVIITALIFLPIWGHSKNYIKTIYPNAKDNIARVIDRIPDKENRRLITIDFKPEQNNNDFSSEKEFSSAIYTNGKNFKSFLRNSIEQFQLDDVVIVSEVKNNKQLTTYVLPGIFNTNMQYDKYFVFYNDINKNEAFKELNNSFNSKSTQSLFEDTIAIREDLILREIKVDKQNRIYFKFDFLATKDNDWRECRFYFHGKAYDDDIEKLPVDRIEYGFEGWDFTVTDENTIRYGNSMYLFQDFEPSLIKYKEFSFGIFRGCTKSKEFKVKNVNLQK